MTSKTMVAEEKNDERENQQDQKITYQGKGRSDRVKIGGKNRKSSLKRAV